MSSKAANPGQTSSRRPPPTNGGAPKGAQPKGAAPPAIKVAKAEAERSGSTPTDRESKGGKKGSAKGKSSKAGTGSTPRGAPQGAPLPSAQATGAGGPAGGGGNGVVAVKTAAKSSSNYLSEELLGRKPLEAKLRDQLAAKCGKAVQEVSFSRNEAHRPAGRADEGSMSRHERVPPSAVVLMFNCHNSSFTLIAGDLSTLPEAETIELKSATSGVSIGRMKIAPEKNTPIEDRIEFPNEWRVGSEHGLHHDGLQADGYIELRIDWKAEGKGSGYRTEESHVAMLRVNPWLAYGCGEGARIAIRKPGALEGTASTVQRTLRDDSVVVRRDGAVGEVTVDPTPFTVVLGTNPRHPAATRLLFVNENACVDALVEPWPESEIDIKEGSRHVLKVEAKTQSGWVTMVTKEGVSNFVAADDGNEEHFVLTTSKALPLRAGCDPSCSEKVGSIAVKTIIRKLEERDTEEFGLRAYVSTIPGQAVTITAALNEFNHSVQRFPSVAEYEAARANYCEDIIVREALVEDAITGNMLRIKDQTLHISTATEAQDNVRSIPAEWNVNDVRDLVGLLLVSSPNRAMGLHPAQPVLVRAGPGTGKTWMAKQAVFTLADRLQRGMGANDGIRLVPIVVFVQRIIYLLREASTTSSKQQSLLGRYIESVYSGKKYETWCDMLMQAYEMRALIVLLDGVDEAAGLRDQIEGFVHKELVPSGNRVLVTSRPEGIRLETYSKTFIVMNLCQLTNEQQRKVINIQMEGNVFFDHLLSLGEVRKALDDAYRKIGALTRGDLESMWSPNRWLSEEAKTSTSEEFNPEERQHEITGQRIVAPTTKAIKSKYLKEIDAAMKAPLSEAKPETLLDRIDKVMRKLPASEIEAAFADAVLQDFLPADEEREAHHEAAVELGVILQKRKAAEQLAAEEKKKSGKKDGKKSAPDAKATTAADGTGDTGPAMAEAVASKLWDTILKRTDEIYLVAEHIQPTFQAAITKLVFDAGRDAEEAVRDQMLEDIEFWDLMDPVKLYQTGNADYDYRFSDGELPESCVPDVLRARVSLPVGQQIVQFVNRLSAGVGFPADGLELKVAEPREPGEEPPPNLTELKMMQLVNRFHDLDPTHFRQAKCLLKVSHKNVSAFGEVEVHYTDILRIGESENSQAYAHYNFFRKRLENKVPARELDGLLEEKLVFLVDATGIPVLLSLLVLIFTSGGEDLTKLPSNRIELYELGIDSAIHKRLLPGNKSSTDQLIHEWLRLFNLDRSAMQAVMAGVEEKKEREHRPTRKAGLNQEHKFDMSEATMAKEADSAEKDKKAAASKVQSNEQKQDKKLFNLDQKEVYEVFKHGSHYLREANKPEVQRTELNRIELSMPKKLVDTVMMLVNSNLKMLLGGKSQQFGLTMLRHVAVSNQLAGRREFSAAHVAKALLLDQVNTEGLTLWLHLDKEEGGLPLTKTLEAQTELAPAQYQFKHLSFQEGLFAQHLLIQAAEGWEGWATDETAATFLNNPFMNNTCRIAAGHLGTLLAKRRPTWDYSADDAVLTEVGLQALWLIGENNETLKTLNLQGNGVGGRNEDAFGLARMLSTSTSINSLNLGKNCLGDLKLTLRAFGRGLGSNKTLTHLNVASNNLLPDGIKVVCNALRSCTSMKWLDLSYNSPGREPALASLLQVHSTLRSVGIVEKEPTTRSERTWWLDTRAKEAVGRALLHSGYSVMFLQCDVFSLNEDTTQLQWRSAQACDAIVLAGVLRANTVLKTLNIGTTGTLGDFEREELGRALLANKQGKVGYCDIYGLKEGQSPSHTVDLKDKEAIRSLRSFTFFAGLMRANNTITSLTLSSVIPDHVNIIAESLSSNTTLQELRLEQPSKGGDTAVAVLPVQELNGGKGVERIDLWDAGGGGAMHRHACAVVGALLNVNTSVNFLRINPGGSSEGGTVLEHIHRARKSTLRTLDVTGIGLGDRGGSKFFETMLAGQCGWLTSLHLGSNKLTDAAVGPLIVEVLRSDACNIVSLDLKNNLIGGPVITQAIKFNKSLTALDITGNPIEDDGLWLIGGLLLEDDCQCKLRSISTYAFTVGENDEKISLQDATLEAGAVRLLFGVLKYNKAITDLDLSGSGISASSANDLATAISVNKSLKTLDLSRNPISTISEYEDPNFLSKEDSSPSKQSVSSLNDTAGLVALANAVLASSSLEGVTLEGGKLPVTQLKGIVKVKSLDLSRRNFSHISSIFIGTLLAGNHSITDLSLHSNELSPVGARLIVERLTPSVKHLDIANTMRVEERSKTDKKNDKAAGKGVAVSSLPAATLVDYPPSQLAALWTAVTKLSSLEKLTMDRDHLEEISTLGTLTAIKTLSLSNNKLYTLPEDICLIKGLKSLSLHGNRLRELHSSIGQLVHLEKLDLRSNQLTYLPTAISQLRNLKHLDASENLLVSLEPSICDLVAVERLELKDNPLQKPPLSIARQGIGAIRRYFQELAASGETTSNGARLVLLGHGEAGKTSLQRGLRAGAPRPAAIDDRTIQLDIYSLVMGEGTKQVVLSMWDLAGQQQYAAALQPYIVDGSLYLLTVPALDIATLTSGFADYVGRWLEYLQAGAPDAIVLPVLTKCDFVLPKDKAKTVENFEEAASAQVEWLKAAIARHQDGQPEGARRLRVQDHIHCMSAVEGGDESIDALRKRLDDIVFSDPPLLPSVGQLVPRTWLLAMTFLRALRDGRDPVEAGWAAERASVPTTGAPEKLVPRAYITYEEAKQTFLTEFAPGLKMQVPDDALLADARNLLCNQGEIFSSSGIIYLQPDYVTRLLKPLVDHRLGKKFLMSISTALADGISDAERASAMNAAEALVTAGELREELLPVLWEPVGLKRDDFGGVALMLSAAGVLFLAEHTQRGRRWVMPMRLPDLQPTDARNAWSLTVSEEDTEVLGVSMRLGHFAPPGILERLMSSCYGLGKYHKFWKRGALIETDMHSLLIELRAHECLTEEEEASRKERAPAVGVIKDHNEPVRLSANQMAALQAAKQQAAKEQNDAPTKDFELTIEFCGDKQARTGMWVKLMQVRQIAQQVIDDFPGLVVAPEFACPACVSKKDAQPGWWPLEDVMKRPVKCEKCGEALSLSQIPLNAEKVDAMTLTLDGTSPLDLDEVRFSSDKVRFGKPLEAALGLAKLLGLNDLEEVDRLRTQGDHGLVEEIVKVAREEKDENGWTDTEWAYYLSGTKPPSDAIPGDEGATAPTADPATRKELTAPPGVDVGRTDIKLSAFTALPISTAAGLTRVHVLALRLYSSPVFRNISKPLHDGCSVERPHPYPAVVIQVIDALARLRVAQAEQRQAAGVRAQKAMNVVVEEDDEEGAAAVAAAKVEAAALADDAFFWRGVYGLQASEFKARGGTEISFLSTSKDRSLAQQAALEQVAAAARALSQPSGRLSRRESRMSRESRASKESMSSDDAARRGSLLPAMPVQVSAAIAPSAAPPETPILLMKIRLPHDLADNFPTDIAPFSVHEDEQEVRASPWRRLKRALSLAQLARTHL